MIIRKFLKSKQRFLSRKDKPRYDFLDKIQRRNCFDLKIKSGY
ncbi:hypothetical protein LEP1GSC034_2160 [Leptospira interrogans str. 2003000735]|uniref:Uncharacterized protein n=7 Tax=Leptospira interrogans TaxID=173 RepID=A0A0E2DEG4_LEPIR|nr:hypothetical protein G436_1725 [Leptospira interrogans serovar Hardjo str. Norma]EJO78539.1 hypothetical protein LEP1GSC045_4085 [Leptospira interrogans serovar Pomona str. Kennewicki LC82-25]EKN90561.1 hypothetical protein LEP1GSC027_1702 [Leptospira interrogans str. 2002000624]EKN99174.1 hypothetical protein LEP1GSC014_1510 [Leptospira interrogans serovar Pomona str. Pomona]EKO71969.1 hypothetical protein LEP1GSC069_2764 [Leptospira interrogans serovar Canicola str. Fiocruz LV133]EKO95418